MNKVVLFVVVAVMFACGTLEAKDKGPKLKSKGRADAVQNREHGRRPVAKKVPKEGIFGRSILVSCPVAGPGAPCMAFPFPTTLTVIEHKKDKMRVLGEVATDEFGNFVIGLKPGIYTIVPWVPMPPEDAPTFPPPLVPSYPLAFPVTVEVHKREFTEVAIGYDNGAR